MAFYNNKTSNKRTNFHEEGTFYLANSSDKMPGFGVKYVFKFI